jgi:hypothetical protein
MHSNSRTKATKIRWRTTALPDICQGGVEGLTLHPLQVSLSNSEIYLNESQRPGMTCGGSAIVANAAI